jgi:hypothetical protein
VDVIVFAGEQPVLGNAPEGTSGIADVVPRRHGDSSNRSLDDKMPCVR